MVDVTSKVQIIEHVNKPLSQTVYDTKWVPCSARFVSLGTPARQTGLIHVYSLTAGDIELQAELERPKAFKCGTFGASSIAERHLATGDFAGGVALWDLERLQEPLFAMQGHEAIINCIDGCGGLKGAGAPEIATGGRDGAVHVWDPRQRDRPVASMLPEEGAPARGSRCGISPHISPDLEAQLRETEVCTPTGAREGAHSAVLGRTHCTRRPRMHAMLRRHCTAPS